MPAQLKKSVSAAPDTQGEVSVSAQVLLLREELAGRTMESVADLTLGELSIAVRAGRDGLWALVRRPDQGGLALRAGHAPGGCRQVRVTRPSEPDGALEISYQSAIGSHRVVIRTYPDELPVLRVTSSVTPVSPLLVPFLPRDLYPLDADNDPTVARGKVEAAQRGVNSGLCYLRMEEPEFGSVLYFQNLTALNPYFEATHTKPDGAVGGEWPEMGYLPPSPPAERHAAEPPSSRR